MEVINALGRRKTSVARVYLSKGTGAVTVNKKDYKVAFPIVKFLNQLKLFPVLFKVLFNVKSLKAFKRLLLLFSILKIPFDNVVLVFDNVVLVLVAMAGVLLILS